MFELPEIDVAAEIARTQATAVPAGGSACGGDESSAELSLEHLSANSTVQRARKRRAKARLRRWQSVLVVVLLVAGIATLAYPFVSNYLNEQARAAVVNTQQQAVAAATPEDLSGELARANAYNQQLRNSRTRVTDPFDPTSAPPTDQTYESLLNLAGDGVMGQITIPSVGVSLPIYHGVNEEALEHGAGHLPGTSLPVGGENTHAVITGHTGLPSAVLFDAIDQLQPGDWFVISVLGQDLAYEVQHTEVVVPSETESLVVHDGQDEVTLVTCTPYGVNSHRLLVHATRCVVPAEWENGEAQVAAASPVRATDDMVFYGIAGAALALLAFALFLLLRRRAAVRARAKQVQ